MDREDSRNSAEQAGGIKGQNHGSVHFFGFQINIAVDLKLSPHCLSRNLLTAGNDPVFKGHIDHKAFHLKRPVFVKETVRQIGLEQQGPAGIRRHIFNIDKKSAVQSADNIRNRSSPRRIQAHIRVQHPRCHTTFGQKPGKWHVRGLDFRTDTADFRVCSHRLGRSPNTQKVRNLKPGQIEYAVLQRGLQSNVPQIRRIGGNQLLDVELQ